MTAARAHVDEFISCTSEQVFSSQMKMTCLCSCCQGEGWNDESGVHSLCEEAIPAYLGSLGPDSDKSITSSFFFAIRLFPFFPAIFVFFYFNSVSLFSHWEWSVGAESQSCCLPCYITTVQLKLNAALIIITSLLLIQADSQTANMEANHSNGSEDSSC